MADVELFMFSSVEKSAILLKRRRINGKHTDTVASGIYCSY